MISFYELKLTKGELGRTGKKAENSYLAAYQCRSDQFALG